jgi:hypothetical protein
MSAIQTRLAALKPPAPPPGTGGAAVASAAPDDPRKPVAGVEPTAMLIPAAAPAPGPKDDDTRLLCEKMLDFATSIDAVARETRQTLSAIKPAMAALQANLPIACASAVQEDLRYLRLGSAEQRETLGLVRQDLLRVQDNGADVTESLKALFWVGVVAIGVVATVLIIK